MNKYIRCNKRPTILPPSTCSAAQGNVLLRYVKNSFPCRRVFSLVANKDDEFCLVLSCSNTPIKSKLQHPPGKPWGERAQRLTILDCNDRSRRRLSFRGELTRVEWKLGEKKDILVFDRGRYSNVIILYMVTWIDRYNTRSNFICDTVSYTLTRQGTCHEAKHSRDGRSSGDWLRIFHKVWLNDTNKGFRFCPQADSIFLSLTAWRQNFSSQKLQFSSQKRSPGRNIGEHR